MTSKEYYNKRKEQVREEAVEYSYTWSDYSYSYGELAEIQDYFTRLGRRYGLLREFHENAIC